MHKLEYTNKIWKDYDCKSFYENMDIMHKLTDGTAPKGYTYYCPKCGGDKGFPSPSGMSLLCPNCPWQAVKVTLTPLEEKVEDVAIGVDWANGKDSTIYGMINCPAIRTLSDKELQQLKEEYEKYTNNMQRHVFSHSFTALPLEEQATDPIIVEEKK